MMRICTPFWCRSIKSLRMNRRKRPISSRTSVGGRAQFSELNEKMVRIPMPRSPAARTVRRKASTPRRCPSLRGSPRAAAQRPLPSMMMATWRGTAKSPICTLVSASALDIQWPSHCEDLLLLRGQHPIDLRNHVVGCLLDLLGRALAVVLADFVILFQLLQHINPVAPHMSDRDLGRLGIFVRDFDQLFAALFVQLAAPQTQDLAFGRRREAEIGGRDRLFHRVHHGFVPDLHG